MVDEGRGFARPPRPSSTKPTMLRTVPVGARLRDVPPAVTTVTSTVPVAPGGAVATIWLSELTVKLGADIWAGDGLQFIIDHARQSAEKSGKYDIAAAISKNGPAAYCYLSADSRAPEGPAGDIVVSAKRTSADRGDMSYVVAIPWSRMAPFKPVIGANLGLCVALNEDDGPGRAAFMSGFGDVQSKPRLSAGNTRMDPKWVEYCPYRVRFVSYVMRRYNSENSGADGDGMACVSCPSRRTRTQPPMVLVVRRGPLVGRCTVFSDCHLEVEKTGDVIVVRLGKHQTLDEPTADKISDELLGVADRPDCNHLLLDFSGVTQLSSAMLAKLVQLHRKMEPKGQKLKLCGINSRLRSVFATTMLDRLFDITD